VGFTPSPDHSAVDNAGAAVVTRYELVLMTAGKAVATLNLGKPTPDASGAITVDINATILPLAAGTYTANVTAIGPVGSSAPGTSPPFSLPGPPRVPGPPGAVGVSRSGS
jgi:hypothetical protein